VAISKQVAQGVPDFPFIVFQATSSLLTLRRVQSIHKEPMRSLVRSKIHKATVTEADLNYVGSITIDEDLIELAGFWPGEKVLVVSNTTGNRLETYVIVGPRGSGTITMNGAAAHIIKKGEEIIIMGFEISDKPVEAKFVLVDKDNKFVRYL
jgi:aspartate 1-decarboxylase